MEDGGGTSQLMDSIWIKGHSALVLDLLFVFCCAYLHCYSTDCRVKIRYNLRILRGCIRGSNLAALVDLLAVIQIRTARGDRNFAL